MTEKLVDSQNPHNLNILSELLKLYFHQISILSKILLLVSGDLDQTDDLARLADVAEVLEGDEDEGDVEGEEGEEVDQVHRLDEELGLHRTA